MKELNKAMVDALFRQEAVMLGNGDCVPDHRVAALFGKDAVKHAHRMDLDSKVRYLTGYGVGDYTLLALTYRGFQAAASFYNVQLIRKESEAAG